MLKNLPDPQGQEPHWQAEPQPQLPVLFWEVHWQPDPQGQGILFDILFF